MDECKPLVLGGYGGEESFQAGYGHAYQAPAPAQFAGEPAGREMPVAGWARAARPQSAGPFAVDDGYDDRFEQYNQANQARS